MVTWLEKHVNKLGKVVFVKCPVCNRGPVVKSRGKTALGLPFQIDRCVVCGATFEQQGMDRYKLVDCEPHTLTHLHPPGCSCGPRIFRECYLGMTLTREEWERIAEGGQPDVLIRFREAEDRFNKGELVPHPGATTPFPLEQGEIVYFVSAPVYLHERPLTGKSKEEAHALYITNRRLVITRDTRVELDIPLDRIKTVTETVPGFKIERTDSPTPVTIYPPLYDPASAALQAVLKKFGPQRVH